MMSDTYGPTCGRPYATYSPTQRSWKTSEATSLWALTLSSLTLPEWGGLHAGELCEHPTPARLTREPGYSSLPTPVVNDMGAGKTQEWWAAWTAKVGGHGQSLDILARQLAGEEVPTLPTPRAIAIDRLYLREDNQSNLEEVIARLPGVTGKRIGQQSSAGNTSQDDLHRLQLSLLPEDNA